MQKHLKYTLGSQKGFALILTLIIMAAMTAIGIAAVTTATTDMLIARNEVEAQKAFLLAEQGFQEAIARLDPSETFCKINCISPFKTSLSITKQFE